MARRVLDLAQLGWEIGAVPAQPFGIAPADDRRDVREWLPAHVPGDVRADLIAAGRIPDVSSPEGIAASAWVDEFDWWYRATLPPLEDAEFLVLEADGIDYASAIWIDDRLLATHAGMFARQSAPLPADLSQTQPHELAIRVWSGTLFDEGNQPLQRRALSRLMDRLQPGTVFFSNRMSTTKAQYAFGWDFAPRLMSAGIWDQMRLVQTRGAYIEDLWAYGEPVGYGVDPGPALWHVSLTVTRRHPVALRLEVTIAPDNFEGPGYQSLSRTIQLCASSDPICTADYEVTLESAATRLWWPWDQGEPCLYRVSVRLCDGPDVLDEACQTAGVRAVERADLPGGAPWRFVVNGRPLFLRGANWAPVDVLPGRATEADYDRLLLQARSAGINFLRVWGGGLREVEAFWDGCDRLGIMVWQEFPLACDLLDGYSREASYLDILGAEANGIVRALRGHPSLIAWCGGNEIDPVREQPALQRIGEALAEYDRTRPWIPASPGDGDAHQWETWHGYFPWTVLADGDGVPPFLSEFGLQALPERSTLAEMFPEGIPQRWNDPRWTARKAQPAKLAHYAGVTDVSDLDAAIRASQAVQAAALQAGIEACRIERERCGGVALWQFNEPWPAVSWSVVDHAGRPKAAYGVVARSYAPLLIAARFARRSYAPGDDFAAEIWAVNDGVESWDGCESRALVDGAVAWGADGSKIEPGSAVRLGRLECTLTAAPTSLTLELNYAGARIAVNWYDLLAYIAGPPPPMARVVRWLTRRLLG